MVVTTYASIRVQFFDYLFRNKEGWLCIAYSPKKDTFHQKFFEWPVERDNVSQFVEQVSHGNNVWFAVCLFKEAKRDRELAVDNNLVWADLDYIHPTTLEPKPSCVIRTSEARFQALWRLNQEVPWDVAQDYSRKIAYKYEADKSGWDAGQLLRVPYTANYKPEYVVDGKPPPVELLWAEEDLLSTTPFDAIYLPDADRNNGASPDQPLPDPATLPNIDSIIYAYKDSIDRSNGFFILYDQEPSMSDDWSKRLWRLINVCFEVGMNEVETFVVASKAKCNKYERDNRPIAYLWKEVLKASANHTRFTLVKDSYTLLEMPRLVDQDFVEDDFVDTYKKWAIEATDAPAEYHELSCFVMLSAALAGHVRLDTSFGQLSMNIWGLILGGSTLTRKTTAMNFVKETLLDLDESIIIASEASPEGLLSGLSVRPDAVSVFYKDEISGLFESMRKREYMSGLPEIFTNLYDVPKVFTRRLRKDLIIVRRPYFILFGGGIRDRVYESLSEEHITSGFIPRFLIVSADHAVNQLRPTGPPKPFTDEGRRKTLERLADLREMYMKASAIKTPDGQTLTTLTSRTEAKLTTGAWDRFADIETKLINAADESQLAYLALPTFTRLAYSTLKMAVLLGAARGEPNGEGVIEITEKDVIDAATYTQRWGRHTVHMLMGVGKTVTEKTLDKIMLTVTTMPGVTKSELMRRHHLMAKLANDIITTLYDRGLIDIRREGRGSRIWPVL